MLQTNNNDDTQAKQPSNNLSKAIISSCQDQFQILDFEDIEKKLAFELSDDDIGAVLTCINAKDNIKRIMLAGLVNIDGEGLNPLRGSTVLDQIDLSTVGKHEKLGLQPLLS